MKSRELNKVLINTYIFNNNENFSKFKFYKNCEKTNKKTRSFVKNSK